jgi:hypothetical protein
MHRERTGQSVPASDWDDACSLWNTLANVRKLPAGQEQYRRLACARALRASADSSVGQPGEDSGALLDEAILEEVGLGALPEPRRRALLRHLTNTLQKRVGARIAAALTNEQMTEFEHCIYAGNLDEALVWLQANAPDHQAITRDALDELKANLRANAHDILRAAQESDDGGQGRAGGE